MRTQHLNCNLIELKLASSEAGLMEFSGYGAVFGNVDSYGDVIEPGAFRQFLDDVKAGAQQHPVMLLQHGGMGLTAQDMTPIGVWSDIAEDATGLKVTGNLAETPRGIEIYTLMKMQPRPAITGLSIGYIAREAKERSKPGDPKRSLKRIDLVEISPVTFPANGMARINGVKSAKDLTDREFEQLMLGAGLTRKEALIVMNQGFRQLKNMLGAGDELINDIAELIRKNTQIIS